MKLMRLLRIRSDWEPDKVRQIGLVLLYLGLERAAVDRKQKVTLLDEIAFMNGNVLQDSTDLTLNRDGLIRLDVTDHLNIDRRGAAYHLGDGDGSDLGPGCSDRRAA